MRAPKTILIAVLLAASLPAPAAMAAVQVLVGPTPIVDGEARAATDITVVNEKLAFALAVGSPVPYGVPRGAIIDVAPVRDGKPGRDQVVFADFIPNNWSAWPNTYQRVEVLERGPGQAVVQAVRDWGRVTITTVYTLRANADHVEIRTTMTNGGAAQPDLLSGLTLWPKGGFLFSVPGLAGVEQGTTQAALSDRVVAYDEGWTIALHAPYFDHVGYASKDMYRTHSLAAGESRTFEGWLQVGASGDLAPVIAAEIDRKHLPSGTVQGAVRDAGGALIASPVIVVEKQGKPYGWTLGHEGRYQLALPAGDYGLYAAAKGYSQTAPTPLKVAAGAALTHDFGDLQGPGTVRFATVDARSGKPLDARIAITEGQKPVVEFLGKKTFFTELDRKGMVDVPLAPGRYVFTVSSGGTFLGENRKVTVDLASGRTQAVKASLSPLFDPEAQGWYSADLHHHADQAEAVTPPADLARSELAAGLDVLFVSDHDSMVNLQALQQIADRRGIAFLPGMELSPSWGHFNAYPLKFGQTLGVDTSTANIDELLKEARRLGATVVQSNHPFIPYGYLASLKAGVAPGGFNPGFDLIEMNATVPEDDEKVLKALWGFWNAGHRYYLTAGTDTHDVWNFESGRVRMFAHLDGEPTAARYAEALKAGHAYVSYGPLVFPSVMFGDQLKVNPGQSFTLGFDLKSVTGLKRAELIGGGVSVAAKVFEGGPREGRADFPLSTPTAAWYQLIVEDQKGAKAYTDPIWVDAVRYPAAAEK